MPKLERFLQAQERDYPRAMCEILNGRKEGAWIWYIFPQLRANGHSENSTFYGIENMEEAKEFLHHHTLELRLCAAMDGMLFHRGKLVTVVLGTMDAGKLRSCATLFHMVRPEEPMFKEVLNVFFGGAPCPLTLKSVNPFS